MLRRRNQREKSATTDRSKGNEFWSLTALISGLLRINVTDLHIAHKQELIKWVRKVTSTVAQLQSSSTSALAIKILALHFHIKTTFSVYNPLLLQSSLFSSFVCFCCWSQCLLLSKERTSQIWNVNAKHRNTFFLETNINILHCLLG